LEKGEVWSNTLNLWVFETTSKVVFGGVPKFASQNLVFGGQK